MDFFLSPYVWLVGPWLCVYLRLGQTIYTGHRMWCKTFSQTSTFTDDLTKRVKVTLERLCQKAVQQPATTQKWNIVEESVQDIQRGNIVAVVCLQILNNFWIVYKRTNEHRFH